MLLLDTHIALWWLTGDAQLKNATRKQLAATPCAISVVSVWEVAIKHRIGKLAVAPGAFLNGMKEAQATVLPLIESHVLAVGRMATGHQDPFDLMLLAVAANESTSFLTADTVLADYAELHTALTIVRA
jgi:PIN domain nuclease of toxin-antitoxin system